jgi:hypothetical protein
MKKRYIFVGSLPSHMLGVVSFKQFGQAVELEGEQARDLSLGGAAIARAEDFSAIGFTQQELAKFGAFGAHSNAPEEFVAKQKRAIAAAEQLRAEFEAPAPSAHVEEGQ